MVDDLSLIDIAESDNDMTEKVTLEERSPPEATHLVTVQVEEKQQEKIFTGDECEYSTMMYTDLENYKNSKHIGKAPTPWIILKNFVSTNVK